MFKIVNFWVSSFLPQKLYWYLAGLLSPWQAVLEDAPDKEAVYSRSEDVVDLLEKFNLFDQKSQVLDIGCGVGRAEFMLSKKVKQCVGIDISSSMIRIAQKNIKDKNVNFYVTNGHDLKLFQDYQFDLVFSILVFQHMPMTIFKNYLQESRRILKPSGKLIFQIPVYSGSKPKNPPKNHPWAVRYYNIATLKTILQRVGFKEIRFFNAKGGKFTKNESQALIIAQP